MKKIIMLFLLSGVIAGCADTHRLVKLGGNSGVRLGSQDSVYIAVPRDGVYGDENYPGSGVSTSQILLSAFARRAQRAEVARTVESYDEAVNSARKLNFKYCVIPVILHWEDRATEWSGIPDRVEVKVQVVESKTEKVIESAIIEGKSGLGTFGGDHPQDLLPKPIEEFVSSLY